MRGSECASPVNVPFYALGVPVNCFLWLRVCVGMKNDLIKCVSSSIRLSFHKTRALIGWARGCVERWCARFLSAMLCDVIRSTKSVGGVVGWGGEWLQCEKCFLINSLLFLTKFNIHKSIYTNKQTIWLCWLKFRETEKLVRKHYFYMFCKAALKLCKLYYCLHYYCSFILLLYI